MKLVEVVSHRATAPDVAATALDVCAQIGKHAVRCGDRAGFIVNALLFPYLNDAVKMLEAHYATADDIDSAMKVGCGYPMGPFELLDVVGWTSRWPSSGSSTSSSASPASRPRRCSSTWSPPDASAARPAAGSATTRPADRWAAEGRRSGARSAGGAPLGRRPETIEEAADGDWVVRALTGSASTKAYRCPGCDQEIRPATPHVVSWPAYPARLRPRPLGHRVGSRPAPALAHRLLAGAQPPPVARVSTGHRGAVGRFAVLSGGRPGGHGHSGREHPGCGAKNRRSRPRARGGAAPVTIPV